MATLQDASADRSRVTAATRDLAADPGLIGVRHHSPALAAAMPQLLAAARPDLLLVELPAELEEWLPWLAHPDTVAPVALAAAPEGNHGGPAFYPFADFSPELAALRWAAANGVPVRTCDLPLAARPVPEAPEATEATEAGGGAGGGGAAGLLGPLRARLTGRPGEDLWDRLVEAAAPGCTPEQVRRAALTVGWALRQDAEAGPGVDRVDRAREAWMRERIAAARSEGHRPAVVVGAFHAPALSAGTTARPTAPTAESPPAESRGFVTSLVPYTYPLLDERSGYPAGIRDPEWQHAVWDAHGDQEVLVESFIRRGLSVFAAVRADGHPSGPADARETVRVAGDLARLRGLPAPGRGEFVEAVQTVLAQGDPLGRGRAVAAALGRVLVGTRTGRAAAAAPRSGLGPAVEAELADLGLPGPQDKAPAPRPLRLDPLRSGRDLRRELLLRRLLCCGVRYGEPEATAGAGGTEALGSRWRVSWTPSVPAMLAVAGLWGVTPAQAAEGALRTARRRQAEAGGPTPVELLAGLEAAAECGLPELTRERLEELAEALPGSGTLGDLLRGLALVDRLRAGHIPGQPAPAPDSDRARRLTALAEQLTVAALRSLDGLRGSEDQADAHALVELADRADALGGMRLAHALADLSATGSPMIRGAADAVRVLIGHEDAARLGDRVASWVDRAETAEARSRLQQSLTGLLTAAAALFDSAPAVLSPLLHRVSTLSDSAFVARLPALRGGFDTLSPAARGRLLETVEDDLGQDVARLDADPAWAAADIAARAALRLQGLDLPQAPETAADASDIADTAGTSGSDAPSPSALTPTARWRLLLGRPLPPRTPQGGTADRLGTALDELYGTGHGEGSDLLGLGPRNGRGGREAPFPGVREWAEELAALFGPGIREEVLAAAVAQGRRDALSELDPAAVRPSVDLLRTVLDRAGGLPEARLAKLRPLVARLVSELSAQLATRLRPALTGLSSPRPSRRPGGGLDLHRTIRANLATARPGADGGTLILPERPVFHSRVRRNADWRLILVVDVSGSMESSTVWAALTAAVMAGVPAVTTHFLAFSTEVIDLSDQVGDPLSLLLEVRVGGGTHIAAGLRAARDLVTVPSRTLIAVISDFEEGYPLGGLLAETRHLVGTGCRLIGCASLDDTGAARYSAAVAGQLVAAGMPVAALSPLELARWVGEQVR